jgi:hypothetical protein
MDDFIFGAHYYENHYLRFDDILMLMEFLDLIDKNECDFDRRLLTVTCKFTDAVYRPLINWTVF